MKNRTKQISDENTDDALFAQLLSTGEESTLGNYRRMAIKRFGEKSAAVVLLDYKIAAFGANDPVLADEKQAVELLENINLLTVRS